jgi:hypothetical protein
MAAPKVGIREFRAGLADFIASDQPVAVTRHGHTVGLFIPVKTDLDAERAALRQAAARVDEMLTERGIDPEELVAEFDELRAAAGR